MKTSRTLNVLPVVIGLAGCATWDRYTGDLSVETPEAVSQQLNLDTKATQRLAMTLKRTEEHVVPGNFGAKSHSHSDVFIRFREDGALEEQATTTLVTPGEPRPRGSVQGTARHICGIQPLSSEQYSRAILNNVTVTVGSLFTTTKSTESAGSSTARTVIESVRMNKSDVCRPTPTTAFTFEIARRAQLKQGDGSSVNLSRQLTAKVTCQAKEREYAASTILPNATGSALEVTCTRTYTGDQRFTSRYAYFSSLGFYLPLQTDEPEVGSITYTYQSFKLEAPN